MIDGDEKNIPGQVEHREEQSVVMNSDDDDFQVPKGYWYSYRFIGSMVGIVLLANNLFIGYAMPVSYQGNVLVKSKTLTFVEKANALSLIDAELGMSSFTPLGHYVCATY